jgi:uncharacterized protein YacL
MKKSIAFILGLSAFPALALAQTVTPQFAYTDRVIGQGQYYLGLAVTILMILMTVWFLISVFNFIREKDAAKMKDRKKQMINGLIGLFVAVAVWGIIRIASSIVGINDANNASPNLTCPPGYRPGTGVNAGICVRG